MADADADGRADVIAVNASTVTVALSTGTGFIAPKTWYTGQFRGDYLGNYNVAVVPESAGPRF